MTPESYPLHREPVHVAATPKRPRTVHVPAGSPDKIYFADHPGVGANDKSGTLKPGESKTFAQNVYLVAASEATTQGAGGASVLVLP